MIWACATRGSSLEWLYESSISLSYTHTHSTALTFLIAIKQHKAASCSTEQQHFTEHECSTLLGEMLDSFDRGLRLRSYTCVLDCLSTGGGSVFVNDEIPALSNGDVITASLFCRPTQYTNGNRGYIMVIISSVAWPIFKWGGVESVKQ